MFSRCNWMAHDLLDHLSGEQRWRQGEETDHRSTDGASRACSAHHEPVVQARKAMMVHEPVVNKRVVTDEPVVNEPVSRRKSGGARMTSQAARAVHLVPWCEA